MTSLSYMILKEAMQREYRLQDLRRYPGSSSQHERPKTKQKKDWRPRPLDDPAPREYVGGKHHEISLPGIVDESQTAPVVPIWGRAETDSVSKSQRPQNASQQNSNRERSMSGRRTTTRTTPTTKTSKGSLSDVRQADPTQTFPIPSRQSRVQQHRHLQNEFKNSGHGINSLATAIETCSSHSKPIQEQKHSTMDTNDCATASTTRSGSFIRTKSGSFIYYYDDEDDDVNDDDTRNEQDGNEVRREEVSSEEIVDEAEEATSIASSSAYSEQLDDDNLDDGEPFHHDLQTSSDHDNFEAIWSMVDDGGNTPFGKQQNSHAKDSQYHDMGHMGRQELEQFDEEIEEEIIEEEVVEEEIVDEYDDDDDYNDEGFTLRPVLQKVMSEITIESIRPRPGLHHNGMSQITIDSMYLN